MQWLLIRHVNMLLSALFLCVFAFSPVQGQTNGQIRLVANSKLTFTSGGRLEIYYKNQWGTVCQDRFGSTDARVVCRELGFTYVSRYGRVGSLGYTQASSSTPIWLDEVRCRSSSSALRYCSSSGIGIHNCGHYEDVAVRCSNTTTSRSAGFIRLVSNSGATSSQGRLEIYYNGQWGTVCDNGFGSTEANTVCKELRYASVSRYGSVSSLGYTQASNSTPIWLDEVRCSSVSSRLQYCSNRGVGIHNCSHREDVAVQCLRNSNNNNSSYSAGGVVLFVLMVIFVVILVVCVMRKNRGANDQPAVTTSRTSQAVRSTSSPPAARNIRMIAVAHCEVTAYKMEVKH